MMKEEEVLNCTGQKDFHFLNNRNIKRDNCT